MRAKWPERFRRKLQGVGVLIVGITISAFVGLQAPGCGSDEGFVCGVRLDSDPSVTTSCDGPNEVCVCWTHRCARFQTPDHVPTERNYCPSGFRYHGGERTPVASTPADAGGDAAVFTTPDIPVDDDLGDCVPPALVDWKVVGTQLCEDSEYAPEILHRDAGGAVTSSSSSAGGTGGTGGAGGAGGAGGVGGVGGGMATGGMGGTGGTP